MRIYTDLRRFGTAVFTALLLAFCAAMLLHAWRSMGLHKDLAGASEEGLAMKDYAGSARLLLRDLNAAALTAVNNPDRAGRHEALARRLALLKREPRTGRSGRMSDLRAKMEKAADTRVETERRAVRLAAAGRKAEALELFSSPVYLRAQTSLEKAARQASSSMDAALRRNIAGIWEFSIREARVYAGFTLLAVLVWALGIAWLKWGGEKSGPAPAETEKEVNYRRMFDHARDVVFRTGITGAIEDISPSVSRYGYKREEVIGSNAGAYYVDPAARAGLIKKLLAEGEVEDYQVALRARDGAPLDVSIRAFLLRGPLGLPLGLEGSLHDITARKRAERESLAHAARAEAMLQASPAAIVAMDPSGAVTDWNKSAEAIFGWKEEEVLGRLNPTVPASKQAEFREFLDACLKGGHFVDRETQRMKKGGFPLDVSVSLMPTRGPGGEINGVMAFILDITGRKRAEEKNARLTRLYKVISGIDRAIARARSEKELYREACRIAVEEGLFRLAWVGVPEGKTLRIRPAAFCGRDDGFLASAVMTADPSLPEGRGPEGLALRGNKLVVNNDTVDNPDMAPWREEMLKRCYLSSAAFPISPSGGADAVISFCSSEAGFFTGEETDLLSALAGDIGFALKAMAAERNREKAVAELRLAKENAERILQIVPSAVFTVDKERRITSWSGMAEKLTGFSAGEAIGSPCSAVMAGPCGDKCALYDADTPKPVTGGEYLARRKYGEPFSILKNADLLRDRDGNIVGGIESFEDITGIKGMEKRLLHSQKIEAVGKLAGGVAHDFNNLITAIFGYVRLLRRELPDGHPGRADLDEINVAAERAAALTRQLLAFSRRQALQPKVVNLNDILASMAKMLARLIGEHIEFRLEQGEGLFDIKADPGQLEQVVMNLIVNARDAMPGGGALTAATENAVLARPLHGYHDAIPPGSYATLMIRDNGCGMDAETMSRIFEPFFTTKGPGAGTGLGLSTVYGIVRQSGGYVSVASEPGRGAEFRVYLPATVEKKEPPSQDSQRPEQGGSGSLVLVEDEEMVRKPLALALRGAGYEVIEAGNGMEALALPPEILARANLLITDLIMPKLGGRELAERVNVAKPGLPVIFMSGYSEDTALAGIDEGIAFLQKPISAEALLKAVRERLGSA